MNRFHLKRVFLLLLCCCMLLPTFTACMLVEQPDTNVTTGGQSDDGITTQDPNVGAEKPEPAKKIVPSVAQMQLPANGGMSYIIQISDGRFIIIDGGISDLMSRERMMVYMKEKSPTKEPVIACWFITHMDGDHFNNAYAMLTTYLYRAQLEVQEIAYTFPLPEDFGVKAGDSQSTIDYKNSARSVYYDKIDQWKTIQQRHPNAKYWDMQANEKRTFGDVEVHVLITANERLPESVHTHNLRSAAFKMTFTQGTASTDDDKSFMVFGDCSGSDRAEYMIDNYGPKILKSDVMQVIHHGLAGGDQSLYTLVNPDICLWPTHKERFEGKYDSDGDGTPDNYQYCTDAAYNKYLRSNQIKQRQHYHHSLTTVIDMTNLHVSFWNGDLGI